MLGVANNTTVHGKENVYGQSNGAKVYDGGYQYLAAGGTANNAVLYDPGVQVISAGAIANNTIISGGEQADYGSANATIIYSAGLQIVESGGVTSGATISSGGLQIVSSGGTAQGTHLLSGGVQVLLAGAHNNATTSAAGGFVISTGVFVLSGTQLVSAASATLSGASIGADALGYVLSGGTALNTFVGSGGTLSVLSGGTARGTTISNGSLDLAIGGSLGTGPVTFLGSAGALEIDDTSMPNNVISGFNIGDVIDLASITFDSAGDATLSAGNVLQIVENGQTNQLNFAASENFNGKQFQLSADNGVGTIITLIPEVTVSSGNTLNISAGQNGSGVAVSSGGLRLCCPPA